MSLGRIETGKGALMMLTVAAIIAVAMPFSCSSAVPARPRTLADQPAAPYFVSPALGTAQIDFSGVVRISQESGQGSGFIVAFQDGEYWALTAKHVVDEGVEARVNGELAYVVMTHARDLALVRFRSDRVYPVYRTAAPRFGECVMVAGYPPLMVNGEPHHHLVVQRGSVSWMDARYVGVDAGIHPGQSGGPVFNATGQVVGVAVQRLFGPLGPQETLGLAERVDGLLDDVLP